MFKKLQIKTAALAVLAVLLTASVMGAVSIWRQSSAFCRSFEAQMADGLDGLAVTNEEDPAGELAWLAERRAGRLGLDEDRTVSILSAASGRVRAGEGAVGSKPEDSENIAAAMEGRTGNRIRLTTRGVDYAQPIAFDGGVLIVYVHDNGSKALKMLQITAGSVLTTLLFGIPLALLFGFFFGYGMEKKVLRLKKQTKRIAEGEFGGRVDITSKDELGQLTRSFNDMTARLSEQMGTMSAEAGKAEAILENMTDGILAFDTNGKMTHCNPTAQRLLELPEPMTQDFNSIFEQAESDIRLGDLLYIENIEAVEREIKCGDLHITAHFAVTKDEQGRPGGILCVLHDVTRQQRLENARREFVANVSHELRTPIATIKSYAETVQDMVTENETAFKFTETIISEADRMTRIVKDLLLLSRLEYTMEPNNTRFSMDDLVKSVVDTMEIAAQEKGQRLTYAKSTGLPVFYGDRDRIEQVLYNIISNAIKYTPNGGHIVVSAGKVYNDLYVKVKDNGIGIPEKDLARIFERFYRVDKARSRESGGTGLGLAIAKDIVELHGGKITLRSTFGEGTEVMISLPVLA